MKSNCMIIFSVLVVTALFSLIVPVNAMSDLSQLEYYPMDLKAPKISIPEDIKANNPDTLGAELIEQHEAIQAMKSLIAEKSGMSKTGQKDAMQQFMKYYQMVGFISK